MYGSTQGGFVYNHFDSVSKDPAQTLHQALLRSKRVASDQHEQQDCSEGIFPTIDVHAVTVHVMFHSIVHEHCTMYVVLIQTTVGYSNAVLLKLAENCSETDTHLMLGYLLAMHKVLFVTALHF